MDVGFPFELDSGGRLNDPEYDDHIRQLIIQTLFTDPGERVNRPDFGAGIRRVVFEPQSAEMLSVTQELIRSALERWLGMLIEVSDLTIDHVEGHLTVRIDYVVRRHMGRQTALFESNRPPWLR